MAYFPDVSRGQDFLPNSILDNNVRHLINGMNGFLGCGLLGANGGIVRIQVYNNSGSVIPPRTAVNFIENGFLCGDAVPCVKLTDVSKPWGVTVLQLAAKEIGDCIISGPAQVTLSGSGDYAQPSTSNPSTFSRGATGAPVIFAGSDKGIINLGAAIQENYNGPFALSYNADERQVTVTAGYLNRNGEWLGVAAANFAPSSGMVCVCTTLGSDGAWTTPTIKVATPGQYAFPIGSVEVFGESVTVCSFRIPVAIFMVTDVCLTTNSTEAAYG